MEYSKTKPEAKTPPIQPPMTPSSSTTSFSTYSLFDFGSTSHLFPEYPDFEPFRKHSINGDGADFETTEYHFSSRRASAPNRAVQSCSQCSSKVSTAASCDHSLCQSCQRSECPLCTKKHYTMTKEHTLQPFLPTFYPCAKLKNIPWDASQTDVRNFFNHCRFPSSSVYVQPVHILMDRTTGKTLSDAYVEFATLSDLWRAIETRQEKPLKGRLITITECSQEELLSVVFPKWRGQFQGNMAIPPTLDVVKTMSTAAGGGSHSACPPFITREEINSLLVVCKNYKLHFSRKCAERPFENIISVIEKYPWHQPHLITIVHRDNIYELLKLSIESLKIHLSKDYIQIEPTLLERLVLSGIMCPAFTENQKTLLLQISHLSCPRQLASFQSAEPVYSAYHLPKDENPSIDSLLIEVQQNCHLEPKKVLNNKNSTNNKNGIPLLLHPLESKLSPWAPAYSPNPWKEPSVEPNNNKHTNSKTLAT